jgi:hypothetical protein
MGVVLGPLTQHSEWEGGQYSMKIDTALVQQHQRPVWLNGHFIAMIFFAISIVVYTKLY